MAVRGFVSRLSIKRSATGIVLYSMLFFWPQATCSTPLGIDVYHQLTLQRNAANLGINLIMTGWAYLLLPTMVNRTT